MADDDVVSVPGTDDVYFVRCRMEPQVSLVHRSSVGALLRTARGRSRWYVDVECGSMLWPILRESWPDERTARTRSRELALMIEDEGSLSSHWPSVHRRRRRPATP